MNKPFVWTYSNLHCYDGVCPHQFYRRYIAKDLGPFVETPAIKEGNRGHDAFEKRVGGGKVLPDDMRQWDHWCRSFDRIPNIKVEMKLGITADGKTCDFFADNVAGRGKADVVVMNDTQAVMTDWKFGGNSKYEDPLELQMHALMLKVKYPNLQSIHGMYVWLKEDRSSQVYDLSDFNSTWARINNIVEAIKDDVAHGEFEKRRGPLCDWCPVTDCEFHKNWRRS